MSASDFHRQSLPVHDVNLAGPRQRFRSLPSGIVVDDGSGLMWAVRHFEDAMDWLAGETAANASRLGGLAGWRLPRIDELLGLVDWQRHDPAVDCSHFEASSSWYWTATDVAGSDGRCAWFVDFGRGVADFHPKTTRALVRVVRATG